MADIVDQAEELNETYLLASMRTRKAAGPTPTGFCHNCDEPVALDARWCDTDCRDDWERRQVRV